MVESNDSNPNVTNRSGEWYHSRMQGFLNPKPKPPSWNCVSTYFLYSSDMNRGGTAPTSPTRYPEGQNTRVQGRSHRHATQAFAAIGRIDKDLGRLEGFRRNEYKHFLPVPGHLRSARGSSRQSPVQIGSLGGCPEMKNRLMKSASRANSKSKTSFNDAFTDRESQVAFRLGNVEDRPPTRQLSPKDALGLEFPGVPMTPVDADFRFDRIWSTTIRDRSITSKLSKVRLQRIREECKFSIRRNGSRPKAARVCNDSHGNGVAKLPLSETVHGITLSHASKTGTATRKDLTSAIPITVTRDIPDPGLSQRTSVRRTHFPAHDSFLHSSLDPGFLGLFK